MLVILFFLSTAGIARTRVRPMVSDSTPVLYAPTVPDLCARNVYPEIENVYPVIWVIRSSVQPVIYCVHLPIPNFVHAMSTL
jgi:hypothetical protein